MVEHRAAIEHDLEDEHRHDRRAERHDDSRLPDHGEQDFERMEAQGGGDVEAAIGVMHAMDTPQERYLVARHMLEPDGEIQEEEGDQPGGERRHVEDAEQADVVGLGPKRGSNRGGGEDDPQQNGREHQNREVREPPLRLQRAAHLVSLEARRPQFIGGHGSEDQDEGGKPYGGFGELGCVHGEIRCGCACPLSWPRRSIKRQSTYGQRGCRLRSPASDSGRARRVRSRRRPAARSRDDLPRAGACAAPRP